MSIRPDCLRTDSCRRCRPDRRDPVRPDAHALRTAAAYLLGGAAFWGICFAVLFNLPRGQVSATAILCLGTVFLLSNTGLSLYQVPYATMLAEISREPQVRTRLAGREMVARAPSC